MVTLQRLRYDLIDLIMRTEDAEKLSGAYRALADRNGDIGPEGGEASVIEIPAMEISTTELKRGVPLEEIRSAQPITALTFEQLMAANAEEEWEQSLEELLDSIDYNGE